MVTVANSRGKFQLCSMYGISTYMKGQFLSTCSLLKIENLLNYLMVSTHLKNMLVKLDHFPKDRDENKRHLKTPPSISTYIWSIFMVNEKIHWSVWVWK